METCDLEAWQHDWTSAKKAAKERDNHSCLECGSKEKLEVNHIIPRRGQGYGRGCHNHLDNLETLCHDCHVVVTREQRRLDPSSFTIWDELRVDSRRRVNLGQWRSPYTSLYTIETPTEGVIILTPAVVVTDPEVVRGER